MDCCPNQWYCSCSNVRSNWSSSSIRTIIMYSLHAQLHILVCSMILNFYSKDLLICPIHQPHTPDQLLPDVSMQCAQTAQWNTRADATTIQLTDLRLHAQFRSLFLKSYFNGLIEQLNFTIMMTGDFDMASISIHLFQLFCKILLIIWYLRDWRCWIPFFFFFQFVCEECKGLWLK